MKEEEKEVIKRKARKELLAEQTAAESKEIKKTKCVGDCSAFGLCRRTFVCDI